MRELGGIYTARNTRDSCLMEDILSIFKDFLNERHISDTTLNKLHIVIL
ncbi:hypothetical protein ES703_81502 [subsurface metagenome]